MSAPNGDGAMSNRKYDLLLLGGRVIDPAKGMDKVADIAIHEGLLVAVEDKIDPKRARNTINVEGLIVTPGLIDLHCHCNMYRNPESLDANRAGVYTGCTRILDPGDNGAYTFQAFRKNVVEKSATRIHSWLNAAALGGFMYGLYNTDVILSEQFIDVEAAVEACRLYPDLIKGIKSYSAPEGWGKPDGGEVYDKILMIADLANVPLYIHSGSPAPLGGIMYGEPPQLYGEEVTAERCLEILLEKLRPGDLVSHPFSTFRGSAWHNEENRLSHGIREAYERGVHFDSGRGAHFKFDNMRNVLEAGIVPFTISSDRHAQDSHDEFVRSSSIGLAQHMSEFMAMGMSLTEVITRASHNPAKALRIEDEAGSLHIGKPAEITVMKVREGNWKFQDSPYGAEPSTLMGKELLTPVLTCLDDEVYQINPAFLPDLCEIQIQEDVWSWLKERPARPTKYGLEE